MARKLELPIVGSEAIPSSMGCWERNMSKASNVSTVDGVDMGALGEDLGVVSFASTGSPSISSTVVGNLSSSPISDLKDSRIFKNPGRISSFACKQDRMIS
jgi:hypothetical protein